MTCALRTMPVESSQPSETDETSIDRIDQKIYAVVTAFAILTINVIAGPVVGRRFGTPTATAPYEFIGLLMLSMGFQVWFSPVPMAMFVVPFAALLFVTWAVTDVDEQLLPAVEG